ncbi:MAG: hypothetical protein IPM48_04095 [Saprospiraceae bacterium]|nr:hypothetical protein [Saprospiraceae bacterium]
MTDITGEEYTLGLYHGEESGNIMVYLNQSIMIIDFKIFEDKSYHFYIGHELLHLQIKKQDKEFLYSLLVDTESDTPYNLARKKSERDDQKNIKIGLAISILILIVFFVLRNF